GDFPSSGRGLPHVERRLRRARAARAGVRLARSGPPRGAGVVLLRRARTGAARARRLLGGRVPLRPAAGRRAAGLSSPIVSLQLHPKEACVRSGTLRTFLPLK